MEMHQVRYFVAIAEHLSFTRTAEALGVTQPSLTRAIQKLESELGGILFRREHSKINLTELGRMMLPHLQATQRAADMAKSQASSLQKLGVGSLVLGVCESINTADTAALVLEIAGRLESVQLTVEVASSEEVNRRLASGEFDLAIVAPFAVASKRFTFCLIHIDDLVIVFANGHRFEGERVVPLDALDGESLVVRSDCPYETAIADTMESRGLRRLVRLRSNDSQCIAYSVRSGLGCAVVPERVASFHGLNHRPIDRVPFQHRTMLATVTGRQYSLAVSTLIQQLSRRSSVSSPKNALLLNHLEFETARNGQFER